MVGRDSLPVLGALAELLELATDERACEEKGSSAPEKSAVARRCLEFWEEARRDPDEDDRPLVVAEKQAAVREMFDKLMTIVDPQPEERGKLDGVEQAPG